MRYPVKLLHILCLTLITYSLVSSTSIEPDWSQEEVTCDQVFISDQITKGRFHSPVNYPKQTTCSYRFIGNPNQVVWIFWESFDLGFWDENSECMDDYLEVVLYDTPGSENDRVQFRLCGDKIPSSLKTMQRKVEIIFQTSFLRRYPGFSASYEFRNERYIGAPKGIGPCGGFIEAGVSGSVIKPKLSVRIGISKVSCFWVVRVKVGMQIHARIVQLQLGETSNGNCKEDSNSKLILSDGYDNPYSLPPVPKMTAKSFCGHTTAAGTNSEVSFLTERNRLLIKYTTDISLFGNESFQVNWTQVSFSSKEHACAGFSCKGTTQNDRFCIDNSLRCNFEQNCPETDLSDEENCTYLSKKQLEPQTFLQNQPDVLPTVRQEKETETRKDTVISDSSGWWFVCGSIIGLAIVAIFIILLVHYFSRTQQTGSKTTAQQLYRRGRPRKRKKYYSSAEI